MTHSRFTEEQIIGILLEQKSGERAAKACRHHGDTSTLRAKSLHISHYLFTPRSDSHLRMVALTTLPSATSITNPHFLFTATHVATYSQRYASLLGNHNAGSLSPFDRFSDAFTAIRVTGPVRSLAKAGKL